MVEDKNKLYVGNLPFSVDDAGLRELFAGYALVEDDFENRVFGAKVIFDRETRRSKGFGFVTMQNPEEAEKAVAEMNGKEVGGRALVVNIARPLERQSRPFGNNR